MSVPLATYPPFASRVLILPGDSLTLLTVPLTCNTASLTSVVTKPARFSATTVPLTINSPPSKILP